MTIARTPFGRLEDGAVVERFSLAAPSGLTVEILTYGGIIAAIHAPGRDGALANVVLGYATLDEYVAGRAYFGATIGRYANRIAHGRFSIGDEHYTLARNNGPNALHGGVVGFDKQLWSVTRASADDDAAVLALALVSPDGDEGYPGTLLASVTFTLASDDALHVAYGATTDRDTIVNFTGHSYFNLAGEASGDVEDQELTIFASRYTPVDATLIPTGELAPVAGTPFDFLIPTRIGARLRANDVQLRAARGYDHNWVIDRSEGESLALAVRGYDPASGRRMDVLTTEPGVHVYTGNLIPGDEAGTSGTVYRQTSGWTAETQAFPDSPNRPEFPSSLLRAGATYASRTVLRFSTDANP